MCVVSETDVKRNEGMGMVEVVGKSVVYRAKQDCNLAGIYRV